MAEPSTNGQVPPRGPKVGARVIAVACAAFAIGMVGVAYAAVPLYAMFCSLTGFAGSTRASSTAPDKVLERTITVRFDANVAPGLPWAFAPLQRDKTVKVGETAMAFYQATNKADGQTWANATYNVSPAQAGSYFVKMQCFCFEEQTLSGKETADMPVVFFIDPSIADDPDMNSIKTITLSYTFFPAKPPEKPVARATQPAAGAAEAGKPM